MIPQINTIETGNNIKKLMTDNGLVIRDIQNILGFSTPQAIYKWIHGKSIPTIDNLVILACLFGVTIDDILIIERGE
mgnify:CR=1 FL=1